MVTTIIVLSFLLVILGWIVAVQIIRGNKLENALKILLKNYEGIVEIIQEFSTKVQDPKLIAAFENDDETGVLFKNLQDLGNKLAAFIPESDNE